MTSLDYYAIEDLVTDDERAARDRITSLAYTPLFDGEAGGNVEHVHHPRVAG
jgi:hypothetical protein